VHRISTGINSLDFLIDFLYLGDNVVWEVDAGTYYEFFIKKFIETSLNNSMNFIYVSFNKSVHSILKESGHYINKNFHIIDCFTSGKGKNDPAFLKNYNKISEKVHIIKVSNPSNVNDLTDAINIVEKQLSHPTIYLFDSLTGMQDILRDENATYSFFTYMCPKLYDLESLAYWILDKDSHSKRFKANIRHVTQIVIELYRRKEKLFLKVLKLSRRTNRDAFKPHIYEVVNNSEIIIKPTEQMLNLDIGSKLKEIRSSKNISQKELARKINLTSGFISQIEKDQIIPSIPTLIQICKVLGIKIGEIIDEQKKEKPLIIRKKDLLSKPPEDFMNVKIYKIISHKNFDIYQIIFPSYCSIEKHFLSEEKSAFVYIIKGKASVSIDNTLYKLEEGDCLYFNKSIPANWVNEGGEKLEILSVTM